MNWLIAAIFAYFLFAFVFLVDKYLLTRAIPNPKVYAFYVGVLGILVLALAPFVNFYVPEKSQIILSLLAGAVFIYGLFWLFKALQLFEASRVAPAVGALTPLFTFGLIYLFTFGQESLSFQELTAFVILVLGSILITFQKEKLTSLRGLRFCFLAAFLLSLSFVLIKYVYLAQSFWNGFIWRSIGGFLMAICFLFFFPEIKKEVFQMRENPPAGGSKKTAAIFLLNQVAGAGGAILQNWAIFLAPLVYVPLINALQGIQYAFLFVLTLFLSFYFPHILKEEISREIVFQKIIAIFLIVGGLALLAF